MASITSLEKSIQKLAGNIQDKGFATDVEVFKGGKGFCSTVTLEISADGHYESYVFYANNYDVIGRQRCSGTMDDMKAKFENDFIKTFQS